ncbi:VOC family protein [Couchioplanes caeruleus]|uniref:Dioxygenase n=2 Tax=Couchioplanes caeruleus TaxID=56438 RepID=A0A1K0FS30_9ACTN|nr:VOC family protein [Couchioplanes caeruleus]OJF15647.1 dioxygenase [Couchioplanes caeruleus subsp. caeruleus]ROP33827.1 catechol 2,3-dioxygenase-like lactoylglutathione lyase family enzyme [Couchioplanes caeruleus]
MPTAVLQPRVHHVGVQTSDLDNSVRWYREFFGARLNWELDRFSDLTLSRLPGIRRLVEVATDDLRVHLFDRATHTRELPPAEAYQFQHVCLQLDRPEELVAVRERWIELYESGRFSFARPDGPTDIVVDGDGVSSLYVFDPNGLEFEFTHVPAGPR